MKNATSAFKIALVSALVLSLFAGPAAVSASTDRADYYKGLDLYQRRDYKASIEAFQAQLAKTPEDKSVQKWLQKAQTRLTSAGGESSGSSWIDMPASENAADYQQGIAFYREGKYDEAVVSFKKYLAKNPKHVPTKQWIALLETHLSPKIPSTPAPAAAGSGQFTVENRQILPPVPPLASAAPAPDLMPLNAVATPSDAAAMTELERVKKDLEMRTEQVARSITQTKRALAQTDEAEKVNRQLVAEIEALKSAQPAAAPAPAPAAKDSSKDKRIRDLESELKLLKKDLETAQKGDRAQELAFLEKKQKALQSDLETRSAEVESARKDLETARTELESLRSSQTAAQSAVQSTEQSAQKALKAMTSEVAAMTERLSQAEKDLEDARGAAAQNSSQAEALAGEKAALEQRLAETTGELQQIRDSQQASGAELEKARQETDAIRSKFENRSSEIQSQANRATEAERTLAQVTRSYQESEDARTAAESKFAEVSQKAQAAGEALTELTELRQRLATEIRAKESAFREFQSKEKELKNQIQYAQTALNKQAREAGPIQDALAKSQTRLKELETERKWFEQKIGGLQADAGQFDQKISELQSDLAASRQETEGLKSQIVDLSQRLALPKHAAARSERAVEDARGQNESLSAEAQNLHASLDESERAAAEARQSAAEAGERLTAAENEVQGARDHAASLEADSARWVNDRATLFAEIEKLTQQLKQTQATSARREREFRGRTENAELLLKDSQATAQQVTAQYQKAELARADAERKLLQVAKSYQALKMELMTLKNSEAGFNDALRQKDGMMRDALENAAVTQTNLEESRAQGLRLAQDLQTERLRRAEIEEELSRAAHKEAATRSQIEELKRQLLETLPQLHAIRASLDQIDGDNVPSVEVEQ